MSDIELVRLKGKRRPREPRLDTNGRATARERYDRAYDRNRQRVLREEDTCHICGQPVDKTLSGRVPLGPSVDHLIPVAAGGTHDRANLRLAHQRCNNQRQTDGLVTRPVRARPAARLHPGLIPTAVRIVVITGKLGAGKTTLRHQLAEYLGWQSLSIDDERAAGGNWGTAIHKVTMLTAPALVECVALIKPMKDALGQHNTSILHATCDEAERQRRLSERNTAFGDRDYHDRWPSIRNVDTTHCLTDDQLAELAAWCRQGWGDGPCSPLNKGRGKVVWVARYKDHRGRVRIAKPAWNGGKGTFTLKREAQRAIEEAIAQRTPERASTVAGYLDRWLDTRPRSARTDRTNEGRIRNVLGLELDGLELGEWDMRELRRRHRDQLVARMLADQGRSPGGARNVLRALSAMFEDAITDELAEINPWQGAKVRDDDRRATKRARKLRVFTFKQLHELAAAAHYQPASAKAKPRPAPVYEPMLRVLGDCGLRAGELFALRRVDLDLQAGLLTVSGTAWEGQVTGSTDEKNHERVVPVPPGCLTLLRSMPPRIDTPWLFPTPTGKLWRYSNWHRKVWQPTCEAAGIDPAPHELRHSWVSHLRAAGIDPADLADVAGHGIEVATSRYTHALRRSFDQIREVVG